VSRGVFAIHEEQHPSLYRKRDTLVDRALKEFDVDVCSFLRRIHPTTRPHIKALRYHSKPWAPERPRYGQGGTIVFRDITAFDDVEGEEVVQKLPLLDDVRPDIALEIVVARPDTSSMGMVCFFWWIKKFLFRQKGEGPQRHWVYEGQYPLILQHHAGVVWDGGSTRVWHSNDTARGSH